MIKNKLLGTVAIAAQNVRNVHWNMKNNDFYTLHKITDKVYNELNEYVDQIAEKMLMRNQNPISKYSEFIDNSEIKELDAKSFTAVETVEIVVSTLNTLLDMITKSEWDAFTQPMIDEMILFMDKMKWIFSSYKF